MSELRADHQSGDATPKPPTGRRTNVRWLIIVMAALGTALAYVDRANLSVAASFMQEDIGFSDAQQGVILSAFFWSYALLQMPAGWLVDRVGPRAMYAAACLWWSVWTAAMALTRSVGWLIGTRVMLGVGEAPMMPTNAKIVSRWFPRRERAFASSIHDTGSEFGTALSVPIVTALIAWVGWRGSFVATASLGIVWVLAWLWIYRAPRRQRWTNQAEVAYIEQGGGHTEEDEAAGSGTPMAWRDLFRYPTVWGLFLAYVCRAFVIYFFITWYPDFLVESQGFTLLQLGLYGAIPGLVALAADWGGGLFSDWLVRRGTRLSLARKIPLVSGSLGASVIGLAALSDSPAVALALLSLSYASAAFATGALWSLPADIAPAPRNVASIGGIMNFGSQVGGIISPILVGVIKGDGANAYVVPFAVTSVLCVVGALIWAFVVKVRPLGEQARAF